MSSVDNHGHYYIPHPSPWPIVGSTALFFTAIGMVNFIHGSPSGIPLLGIGTVILLIMMFGWFRTVINESIAGHYSSQVDKSFRWGMGWFIFSEVMFFAAFFGALFYIRQFSVPWLGGADPFTKDVLWPVFDPTWPLISPPGETHGVTKEAFDKPLHVVGAWGVPALNTIILLSSGITVTLAHWGLLKGNRQQLILGLLATVALGFLFIGFQAYEYGHAISELNLTLSSGVYGSTFYMLTGFHGLHVTIGATMLTVILLRSISGHFSAHNHFAFEAVAWYWHFVDVVWLGLFIFVYWL
ncbi:MAG: cytochrome c oxidase subunit 3 [Beggiatoa sp. IS2]|nr:MAG: cytochrome c oxidase subunit 3 [Beggiatoa sp. IS2]